VSFSGFPAASPETRKEAKQLIRKWMRMDLIRGSLKSTCIVGVMEQACNTSYSRSIDWEDCGLRLPRGLGGIENKTYFSQQTRKLISNCNLIHLSGIARKIKYRAGLGKKCETITPKTIKSKNGLGTQLKWQAPVDMAQVL
jgi:hypothetical protein